MIDSVAVIGGGTCGCQIAWQCAMHGVPVAVIERNSATARLAEDRMRAIGEQLLDSRVLPERGIVQANRLIQVLDDGRAWAQNVDLLIESVTEERDIKREVFAYYASICPSQTIFTTNSSYFLPSTFIAASGRPDRLLGFHFHVPVWLANAADVMPHSRTDPEVVEQVRQFAIRIGQVPIVAKREYPGYVFNALLHPLLVEALSVARKGVVDPEQVDLAWRTVTKMSVGPFGMIRLIGPATVQRILETGAQLLGDQQLRLNASYLENLASQWNGDERTVVEDVAHRFLAMWFPDPLDDRLQHRIRSIGPACIIGSESASLSLVHALRSSEIPTAAIHSDFIFKSPHSLSSDVIESLHRCPHLFLLLPSNQESVAKETLSSDTTQLLGVLTLIQQWWCHWASHDDAFPASASLTIATDHDAGFGGMVRALMIELEGERKLGPVVRLVETSRQAMEFQSIQIVRETAIAQAEVLTGQPEERARRYSTVQIRYRDDHRQRLVFETAPLTNLPDDSVQDTSEIQDTRWLVVGGGQGVAFQMAYRLGQLGAGRLVLVGSTQPEEGLPNASDTKAVKELRKRIMKDAYENGQRPEESWEQVRGTIELQSNLRRLQESGISYEYVVSDVTVSDDFVARLNMLYGRHGFDGVIYGAGWERSKRLAKRNRDEFGKTLDWNLGGLVTLCQYIDRLHESLLPRWFVINNSLSARFGAAGQVDCALAKGVASSLASRLAKRWVNCRTVGIEWPKWQGEGMAGINESRLILKSFGHHTIPIDEGLRHFERELLTDARDANITLVHPDEIPVRMRSSTPYTMGTAEKTRRNQ